jgi:hypothetical protein
MPIKTFRGMIDSSLGSNAQDTINLHTTDGSMGYKIVKFEIFPNQPGVVRTEGIVKIFKVQQSAVDGLVDFSDNTLLAAAYYIQYDGSAYDTNTLIVTFDNEVFNQDIYVVYDEMGGTQQKMNYYIELEQVKLDLTENTVATLKDIRNIKAQSQ